MARHSFPSSVPRRCMSASSQLLPMAEPLGKQVAGFISPQATATSLARWLTTDRKASISMPPRSSPSICGIEYRTP
ncbi:hypothetical protein D3C87_1780820 [compost metagenome]